MPGLYDTILHRRLSGPLMTPVFRAALALRTTYFSAHDFVGGVFHRKPKDTTIDPESINKILLIRTDRIGDIVLTMPALSALRKRFPATRIDLLVQKRYASLLNCYQGWSNVIAVTSVIDNKELRGIGTMLKAASYDVTVVLHPSKYAYKLARWSGSKWTIGWKAKGYGYLLTHPFYDDRSSANRHQVENNLRLLGPLGIIDETPVFPVSVTPKGETEVETRITSWNIAPSEKICVVHAGSYTPRVQWLPERYAELIDRIQSAGAQPVLIGSASDQAVVNQVISRTAVAKPLLALDLSLEGIVSLCKRATVFIGNSTGPLHIAASLGIPAIGIFGSRYGLDRHELWAPFGKNGIVVSATPEKCKKCLPWTCNDMACMREVTVDSVWRHVEAVLHQFVTHNLD